MRRNPLVAAIFCTLALAPSIAGAQVFGRQDDVSFAADRLMGIYLFDEGGGFTGLGLGAPLSGHWYTNARFGVDYFAGEHFSIGGALAYFNVDPEGGGDSTSGFLFAPRVGYAIDIGDSFGFWPRGGITFRDVEDDSELALTMEGMFWASPARHFAFIFGPAIDVGLVGDHDEARSIGVVTFGVLGWY